MVFNPFISIKTKLLCNDLCDDTVTAFSFKISLFMDPSIRSDCVAIRSYQGIVVTSNTKLSPGQGSPSLHAFPRGYAALMFPSPKTFIARRIINLKNCLSPAALNFALFELSSPPCILAHVFNQARVLELPVLAPVFYHERTLNFLFFVAHKHNKDVLKRYEILMVLNYINVFSSPRLIGTRRGIIILIAYGLKEIKTRSVRSLHCENRKPILLFFAD